MNTIKLFRITADDLAELERMLPEIIDRHMEICNDTRTRVMVGKIKGILSNVRWDYGPPTNVQTFDANGELPSPEKP